MIDKTKAHRTKTLMGTAGAKIKLVENSSESVASY